MDVAAVLAANAADDATQAVRLAQLKGKKVLWVTAPCIPGMSQGMKDSARFTLEHGVELYGLFHSEQDKLYAVMKEGKLFSHAVFAALDSEAACANTVAALSAAGLVMDAVFSPYEMSQTLVGELAEALRLPGNPAASYTVARSKHLARQATAAAGLACPKTAVAYSRDDIASVCAHVGFPCIVKPSSGAGSCGVLRADCEADVVSAFERIAKDAEENELLRYNPGCKVGVLLEQFLVGDEFDVDMLMWEGELMYSRCVYNWPCIKPYFLETGTNMPAPARFSAAQLEALKAYSLACVKSMGFRQGCFHVEVMLTAEGPVLIEVNSRQGGGPNQVFNLEMHGVNIFANFFMSACGIPINPPSKETTLCMADYAITALRTGVLVDDRHMDAIRAHPAVVVVNDFVKPGGKVSGIDSGFPSWINQFIVKGSSPEECTRIVEELICDIDSRITLSKPAPPPLTVRVADEADLSTLSIKDGKQQTAAKEAAPQDSPKAVAELTQQ